MSLTLNNITAFRVGMALSPTATVNTHSGWIRRANLMYRDTDGSLKRLEFKATDATYAATIDVAKAGVPFLGVEDQWWGIGSGGLTKAPVYTTATLNPGLERNGAVAIEMVVEGASPAQPTLFTADIRRNGGDWERIFETTTTPTGTLSTIGLGTFEASLTMQFRHKGATLAGVFHGYAKGGGDIVPLTAPTDAGHFVEIVSRLTNELVYGTFIPERADLAPKIIGPLKIS